MGATSDVFIHDYLNLVVPCTHFRQVVIQYHVDYLGVIGTYLEDRDLHREFGSQYLEYSSRVPMLIRTEFRGIRQWLKT